MPEHSGRAHVTAPSHRQRPGAGGGCLLGSGRAGGAGVGRGRQGSDRVLWPAALFLEAGLLVGLLQAPPPRPPPQQQCWVLWGNVEKCTILKNGLSSMKPFHLSRWRRFCSSQINQGSPKFFISRATHFSCLKIECSKSCRFLSLLFQAVAFSVSACVNI